MATSFPSSQPSCEFGPVFADAATLKQWKAGFKGALPLKPATSKTANGKR